MKHVLHAFFMTTHQKLYIYFNEIHVIFYLSNFFLEIKEQRREEANISEQNDMSTLVHKI